MSLNSVPYIIKTTILETLNVKSSVFCVTFVHNQHTARRYHILSDRNLDHSINFHGSEASSSILPTLCRNAWLINCSHWLQASVCRWLRVSAGITRFPTSSRHSPTTWGTSTSEMRSRSVLLPWRHVRKVEESRFEHLDVSHSFYDNDPCYENNG